MEGFFYVLLGIGSSWILARWEGLTLTTQILSQTSSVNTSFSFSQAQPPRPQFIFTMALLSGNTSLHETLGKSIEQTTAMDTLHAIGATPLLVKLHKFLYQSLPANGKKGGNKGPTGLWNAHCEVPSTKADSSQLNAKVVQVLEQISHLIQEAYVNDTDATIFSTLLRQEPILPIPINTVLWKMDDNMTAIEDRFGYATFPTEFFGVSCHRKDFPSLDLLYTACQMAKVDCRHVYVHRPPLWELKQIMTGRMEAYHRKALAKINSANDTTGDPAAVVPPFGDHLAVLQLWNTMLHVMADELTRFAPRGLGCIHSQNYQEVWNNIWGGGGHDDDMEPLQLPSTLFPMKDIPRSELDSVIPTSAAPYVESYLQLFQTTNQACEDSYQQLQDYLSKRNNNNKHLHQSKSVDQR
jgi:hypothetical protein